VDTVLSEERAYYDEQLPNFLSAHAGRFVLIRGRDLLGVYDRQEETLSEGARRFGLSPFLVRRVEQTEPEVSIPALTLGLLNADSSHSSHGTDTRPER
jgi:hypothetical protein